MTQCRPVPEEGCHTLARPSVGRRPPGPRRNELGVHRLPQVPGGDGCVHVEGHLRWATSVREQPLVSAFHFGDRCGKCRLLVGDRDVERHRRHVDLPGLLAALSSALRDRGRVERASLRETSTSPRCG